LNARGFESSFEFPASSFVTSIDNVKPASSVIAMLKPLPNPDFFNELLLRLKKAKREIVIVNYLAEIPGKGLHRRNADPVTKIARALIRAQKRGVGVSIILEGSKFQENYPFYRMMKDAGNDAWLDTSKSFIHHKIVVIDEKLLFVGSHNLTYAAMTTTEESSVITDDARAIRRFKKEIGKITKQREDVRKDVCREKVRLPEGFIMNVARPLYRARAGAAFDLYMQLLREEASPGDPIPIKMKGWCELLGYDPKTMKKGVSAHYRKNFYRQRINRILYQLKNRFKLITIDRKTDTVMLTDSTSKVEKDRHSRESGNPDVLEIPVTYWKCAWPRRLSMAAKYFFLISLNETKASPFYPWWKLPVREIEKRYRCDHGIGKGARELADSNILEILRGIPVKGRGGYREEAQFYRVNPFYRMEDFEKRLKKLEKKFSKKTVGLARRMAGVFWESHDLETIGAICGLIKKHGRAELQKQYRFLSKLSTSSSRRSLDYLRKLSASL